MIFRRRSSVSQTQRGAANHRSVQRPSGRRRYGRRQALPVRRERRAQQLCAPVSLFLETIADDTKTVIVVDIPKGDQRPYKTNRGVYYVRTASGRRQATREELLRMFQASESMF